MPVLKMYPGFLPVNSEARTNGLASLGRFTASSEASAAAAALTPKNSSAALRSGSGSTAAGITTSFVPFVDGTIVGVKFAGGAAEAMDAHEDLTGAGEATSGDVGAGAGGA